MSSAMNTTAIPSVQSVDHVHVFVENRAAAEEWYERVLGFTRVKELEFWAFDGGPLTIQNREGTVHIALFEQPAQKNRSTIALCAGATDLLAWKAHLTQTLEHAPTLEDHAVSVSLYFRDPDGNPYEITTYEYEATKQALASK